jgi:OPA family glycerol-3-phosphate transporter-like MFS transporter
MIGFLKPLPHKEPIANKKLDDTYKKLRWKVFAGIFIGYAGYYLVRKNFSLIKPDLIEMGWEKAELGMVGAALSIAYGISKFVMGNVSDRSNPKVFLSLGLGFSALIMGIWGLSEWAFTSLGLMIALNFLNGWVQGMGWPACGRTLAHWFSQNERGTIVSIWNVAHNIGGALMPLLFVWGLVLFNNDWKSALYFPAAIAIIVAIGIYFLMEDTPQSCGLPPIENHKNDSLGAVGQIEHELSAKDILFKYVLNNKWVWCIAIANAFIYLIRYGVLDWAPTYLHEVKSFDKEAYSWAFAYYELAGIPGTILCGYLSDKWSKGHRAPITIVYMLLVMIAIIVYWTNPAGQPTIDLIALFAIGFLIYGPVMIIGAFALDLVPKKAAGTAAGFTGLFGYVGGALTAELAIGYMADHYGWDACFQLLIAASALSVLFVAYTLKYKPERKEV